MTIHYARFGMNSVFIGTGVMKHPNLEFPPHVRNFYRECIR